MRSRLVIAIYLLIAVVPILLGISYSLLYSFGLVGLMNDGFTLDHWRELFSNASSWSSLLYTLRLTLISLCFILIFALGSSWSLYRKNHSMLLSGLTPLLFPPIIAAFVWYYLLSPAGRFSRLSYRLQWHSGIDDFPRLVNDALDMGIITTHVFLVFPLFSFLFLHQARSMRLRELQAVSTSLGASSMQFFRKVFLPLVLKRSFPLIVLYGIFLFNTFEVPLLLGRSNPQAVTVFITEKLTRYNLSEIPQGHAMAVLYCFLIFSSIFFFRKRSVFLQS